MIIFQNETVLIKDDKNFRYLYLFGVFEEHAYQAKGFKHDWKRLFGYERNIFRFVQQCKFSKVLIVGCGSGSIVRAVRFLQLDSFIVGLDMVEQLPQIIESYFGGFPVSQFIHGDALVEIDKLSDELFDLVIVDVYGETANQYSQTDEFAEQLGRIIKPGGSVIQHFYCRAYDGEAVKRINDYTLVLKKMFLSIKLLGSYSEKFEGMVFYAKK